jgi:dTDP-L-rhamnose 4-epimerase
MANIFITGGAGFIGSNLALQLLSRGHRLRVMDNLSEQIHADYTASPLYQSIEGKVEFVRGDVRNRADWEQCLQGQEVVVHLAAETGTGQSMYEIEKYVDVNIKGTGILLDILANQEHSVQKVVVASSRSIYGEGKYECQEHGVVYPNDREDQHLSQGSFEPRCPSCGEEVSLLLTDEDSKIHPSSIYGITKQNQEQMVLVACKSMGIGAVALRYQNVYGPGQSLSNPYTGILSIFSTRLLNHNPINIFEDGEESRDFVFIDDVVSATIACIEKEEANHQVFNVGSGEATSVSQVAAALKSAYQSDVDISVSGDYRLGDIRHNVADISRARAVLGFEPQVMFEEGIRRFSDWVKQQEVQEDKYEASVEEMKRKGLMK